jgi:SPP1 family predicted phage head-tail adaptor
MRAGTLRHSIVLQSPTGTLDSFGERNTTWNDVATVRASINPITTREQFLAQQAQSSVTHKVTVRYGSEISTIDSSWRVLFGSRVFVIQGIRNIDERNKTIELLCEEGLKNE